MNESYLKLVIKLIKNQSVTDEEALILIKNIRNDFNSSKEQDGNFWVPSEEINHPKTNKDIQPDKNVSPKWLDKGIVWDKNTWTQKRNTTTTPFNPWEHPWPWETTYFPPGLNVTCETNSFHDEYKVPDKK